jgi:hypothetical protein
MPLQVRKLDRHGRPLPDDEDVIPDGGMVRVPATFMDHLPPELRRALGIMDAGTDMQGFIPGHRPGFAVAVVKDEAARDEYIRNVGDAWKHPPAEQPTLRTTPSSPPKPSTHDAEQAYRAYVDRISNAWRAR